MTENVSIFDTTSSYNVIRITVLHTLTLKLYNTGLNPSRPTSLLVIKELMLNVSINATESVKHRIRKRRHQKYNTVISILQF